MNDIDLIYKRFSHKDRVVLEDSVITVAGHINYDGYTEGCITVYTENGDVLLSTNVKDIESIALVNNIVGELKIYFKNGTAIKMR
jgi:antitoxin component YwqK of YwqJK toxin-antitoxin module